MKAKRRSGSVTFYGRPPWFTEAQRSLFDLRCDDDVPYWEVLALRAPVERVLEFYSCHLDARVEEALERALPIEGRHLFAFALRGSAWTQVIYCTEYDRWQGQTGAERLALHAEECSRKLRTEALLLIGADILAYENGKADASVLLNTRVEDEPLAVSDRWHAYLDERSLYVPPVRIVRSDPVELVLWGPKPEDVPRVASIVVPSTTW